MKGFLIILIFMVTNMIYCQKELGMSYSDLVKKENTNIREIYKFDNGSFVITNNFMKNSKIIYEFNTIECIVIYIIPNDESAYEYYKKMYTIKYKDVYEIIFYDTFLTITLTE